MGSRQQLGRATMSFWVHWLEAQTKQTAVLQPGPVVGYISCMGLQAPAMQKKKKTSLQREIEGLKTTIDDAFFFLTGRSAHRISICIDASVSRLSSLSRLPPRRPVPPWTMVMV